MQQSLPELKIAKLSTNFGLCESLYRLNFITLPFAKDMNIILYYVSIQYLTKKLGVDAKTFGYLQTTFSVLQLCGGPVYGRFGDLVGARYALVLAFSASATAYGLLAIAQTIPLLFLSRAPSVLMASMQGKLTETADILMFLNLDIIDIHRWCIFIFRAQLFSLFV